MKKKTAITMVLGAAMLAAPLLVGASAHANPATATPASYPDRTISSTALGVRFDVRNDSGQQLEVFDRKTDDSWVLNPGESTSVFGKFKSGVDDLEIEVAKYDPKRAADSVFEIDGSNPALTYPSVSVSHVPTGGWSMKRFSVNEADYMSYGRIWVKRNGDGGGAKQFDVHIKRLS